MRISVKRRILIVAILASAAFTGCNRSGRAEEARADGIDKMRFFLQKEKGLPEREYSMAAVTEKMIYGYYQEDNIVTIALFSRESGKIEKQVPLPEKVSYVQDMRVDKGGNLHVISNDKLGGSGTHWKIDRKGNLREI